MGGTMLTATPIIGAAFDNQTAAGVWIMGIVLPLVLSRAGRQQLQLAHELATTRAALADQRVLEERRRIARDVHDSVGHGLAAVLLHVTGARHSWNPLRGFTVRLEHGGADVLHRHDEGGGDRSGHHASGELAALLRSRRWCAVLATLRE